MARITSYLTYAVPWSLAGLPNGLSDYINAHARVVIDIKSARNSGETLSRTDDLMPNPP
jgi:hypothetical protein